MVEGHEPGAGRGTSGRVQCLSPILHFVLGKFDEFGVWLVSALYAEEVDVGAVFSDFFRFCLFLFTRN